MANKKYIPCCAGISGTMSDLDVDSEHQKVTDGIPVNLLILELVQASERADLDEEEALIPL
jgi:hypothetical protein